MIDSVKSKKSLEQFHKKNNGRGFYKIPITTSHTEIEVSKAEHDSFFSIFRTVLNDLDQRERERSKTSSLKELRG